MSTNADAVLRSADAVLGVDLGDLELRSRVPQIVVGLCRAAFAQSKVIATLASAGMLAAAAPNRRLVLEIVLRLNWLSGLTREERRRAVDTMLAKDRRDTSALLDYLRDLGHEADFDRDAMEQFVLDAVDRGPLHQQATRLAAAASIGADDVWAVYAMWREETKFAHASGGLAGKYAPTLDDQHLSSGEPDPMDPDLEGHRVIQLLVVTLTSGLLTDEGVPSELAGRIAVAFLEE